MLPLVKDTYHLAISKGVVLVFFYGPACRISRNMHPILVELSDTLEGKVLFCKVDVEECPDLAKAFKAQLTPRIVIYNKGEPQIYMQGTTSRRDILDTLLDLYGHS